MTSGFYLHLIGQQCLCNINVYVQIKIEDTNSLVHKQYTTTSPFHEHNTH